MISTLSDALTDEEIAVSSQGYTSDQQTWDRAWKAYEKAGYTMEDMVEEFGERPKA